MLWRSTYVADSRIYADGIRIGPFTGRDRIYQGESEHSSFQVGTFRGRRREAWRCCRRQRFSRLSDGYLAWHPRRPRMLGDARYAMLPTSVAPLWGLAFETDQPGTPASLVTDRTLTTEQRRAFVHMLLGR